MKGVRVFQMELEIGDVGFWGAGKTRVPAEKPLGASKGENHQQTQPTSEIWFPENSHHCTTLAPLGENFEQRALRTVLYLYYWDYVTLKALAMEYRMSSLFNVQTVQWNAQSKCDLLLEFQTFT